MGHPTNEFQRLRRDCLLGIKAVQNLHGALEAFDTLLSLVASSSHVILTGVFHSGVIRYAKPFLQANTDTGTVSYPTRHLKAVPEFSLLLHKHLLDLRNTLIAHDDFTQVEPRILTDNMRLDGTDYLIPMRVTITNKCLGYPADESVGHLLRTHISAAHQGANRKLREDLGRLRQVILEHPEQARAEASYERKAGSGWIEAGGSHVELPETIGDPWLDVPLPDYSSLHKGYHYEDCVVRREFNEPETITLPDGGRLITTKTP